MEVQVSNTQTNLAQRDLREETRECFSCGNPRSPGLALRAWAGSSPSRYLQMTFVSSPTTGFHFFLNRSRTAFRMSSTVTGFFT